VTPHPETPEHDEPPHRQAERFARIRRVKQMLKFMPRRAVLHKYPLVGRFAEMARKRAFLWSLKYEHMRPSFYAGSILSLLPVMGVQLPLALLLSLLLRANFMVMGGLQFITNPFTAAPIYYATHQLGVYVITTAGFGEALPAADPNETVLPLADEHDGPAPARKAEPTRPSRVRRIGTAINALIVGGVISGAALGLVLDILYRNYWQHHTHAPPRRRRPRASRDA
jgi:uncharacterized protein (DUF2062 family)